MYEGLWYEAGKQTGKFDLSDIVTNCPQDGDTIRLYNEENYVGKYKLKKSKSSWDLIPTVKSLNTIKIGVEVH